MERRLLNLLMVCLCLACAACSGSPTSAGTNSDGVDSPSSLPASAAPTRSVTKLLVLVVENHSLDQMREQMPYTAALARLFGYATEYRGVAYPSLPNYIAMTSGSTHDITDDKSPDKHRVLGRSVFGQAMARGSTAAVYADGMATDCEQGDGGDHYAVKHNPWAYYENERGLCREGDVPATRLADAITSSELPNVGMVVPNMCHDAHDCDLSVADTWISHLMTEVFRGPDWKSGHLALVITADTDDRKDSNRVLTVVIHPSQRHNVVDSRLDHYSLSRLYSEVVHADPLGRAASAPSLSDAFGLPIG